MTKWSELTSVNIRFCNIYLTADWAADFWLDVFFQTCFCQICRVKDSCLNGYFPVPWMFCFSVYNLNIFLPTMMTSRWGENREGRNPGTVLLVSVERQNIAQLCCGFHLINIMSRKKQTLTPRPQLEAVEIFQSVSSQTLATAATRVFFYGDKDLYVLRKEKLDDIKIGSGFCKISLFYKGWPWLLGWVLPSPSYYWELIWMLSVIQLTFNPAQLCNQCVDLIIKICL